MKKAFLMAAVAMAAVLGQGCNDGPTTPVPPELGDIQVSQAKIGVGHQVVFTVDDKTVVSGTVTKIDPVWTINGSVIPDIYTDYENTSGLGHYVCYYVPMNTGTVEVILTVDMEFGDAPVGEDELTVTVQGSFDVMECDARNSFWGDSAAITMYREPGLVKRGASEEYIGEGSSSILGISNYVESVNLTYTFSNGGLEQITESFNLTSAQGYAYIAEVYDFALRVLEAKYASGKTDGREAIYNTNETSYMSVASKYIQGTTLTSEEKAVFGEGMVRGFVRVEASMSTTNTNIIFTTEALPDSGSCNMVLTYSKR